MSPNEKERLPLAKAGALNDLPAVEHRRDALWQVELPLYNDLVAQESAVPILAMMTPAERLAADFTTQGASTGPHPMKLWRERNGKECVSRAVDLHGMSHGTPVLVAGMAICRQRWAPRRATASSRWRTKPGSSTCSCRRRPSSG